MKNENSTIDKLICILVSFMIMSFYLFELASWGRYVLFGITIIITLLNAYQNNMTLCVQSFNQPFHKYVAAFAIFSLLSAVWAWNPSLAISKGITIISILICFSFIYSYYKRKGSIDLLLLAFMISGYGICVYTVFYYGLDGIMAMLSGGSRLGNDFTNANSIGLIASTSCTIQFYYLLQKEKKKFSIFLLPAIISLTVSQSRKAFIMLIVGIMVLTISGSRQQNLSKKIIRLITGICIFLIMIFLLSNLKMFSGVFGRFQTLFESMNGTRAEDIRAIYRRIGLMQFYKTPILGIGMGNSLELLESVGQRRTYLHCNFVELLSSGGIIGFSIYYMIYVKLGWNLWKYKNYRASTTNLCFVLLMLMLIMDYGMVTYYDKQQYLYFMCFFLQIRFIKNDYYQRRRYVEKMERKVD